MFDFSSSPLLTLRTPGERRFRLLFDDCSFLLLCRSAAAQQNRAQHRRNSRQQPIPHSSHNLLPMKE